MSACCFRALRPFEAIDRRACGYARNKLALGKRLTKRTLAKSTWVNVEFPDERIAQVRKQVRGIALGKRLITASGFLPVTSFVPRSRRMEIGQDDYKKHSYCLVFHTRTGYGEDGLGLVTSSDEDDIALGGIDVAILQEERPVDAVLLEGRELKEQVERAGQVSFEDDVLLAADLGAAGIISTWCAGAEPGSRRLRESYLRLRAAIAGSCEPHR